MTDHPFGNFAGLSADRVQRIEFDAIENVGHIECDIVKMIRVRKGCDVPHATDLEIHFLVDFARQGLFGTLTRVDKSAWQTQFTFAGFASAANEEHFSVGIRDDRADGDGRTKIKLECAFLASKWVRSNLGFRSAALWAKPKCLSQ